MKVPTSQILEDEDVQRSICLIVNSELEEADIYVKEKVLRLKMAEEENTTLKKKIVKLERANLRKSVKIEDLKKKLENEKERRRFGRREITDGQDEKISKTQKTCFLSKPVKQELELSPSPKFTKARSPAVLKGQSTEKKNGGTDGTSRHGHGPDISRRGWTCVCGKEFKAELNLKMHFRYFQAGHKFSCTKCSTKFVYGTDMRKHLKIVHNIQPDIWMKYGCRLCGCFFMKISHLLNHRKEVHGDNPKRRKGIGKSSSLQYNNKKSKPDQ